MITIMMILLLLITIIMKTSFNSTKRWMEDSLRVWEVVCLYVEAGQGVTSGENRFITA